MPEPSKHRETQPDREHAATRRWRTSLTTLATATLVLAIAPAVAQAGSSQIAGGLHISTGALVDPDGRTWIADHNAGFCRVSPATEDGAGSIEHPERPGDPGPRTCLGGLLPDAGTGPDAAGAPVLVDPSPEFPRSGDEMALIPDGASPSSEVVRARWNDDTGLFEFHDTVSMLADRGRPQALSVGPDENVYVTFQREASIQRIVAPASGAPRPEIVGRPSDGRGPAAVAVGGSSSNPIVYVAETGGLRKLRPSAAAPPLTEPAWDVPAPGGAGPTAISALSYDLERDLLWAGTANGVTAADGGKDTLVRIDTLSGTVAASHTTGFTMVGGVNAAADGTVLVLDDPALVDPAEPLGAGRMFVVGPPAAHVARGPLTDDLEAPDRSVTRDSTPGFEITGDGTQECLLRGPGRAGGWADCPTDGRLDVTVPLLDGTYRLAVRATVDGRTGPTESHRFTVDTIAPAAPRVAVPVAGATVSATPWYVFDAEDGVTFDCRFDATSEADSFADCAPGRTRSFPGDPGLTEHTLELKATDRAGNTSVASAVHTFTVDPALEPTQPPLGPGPTHRGSSRFTDGLHISTGAIVDPEGRVWVADHNAGFCRTTPSDDDGPGRVDHPEQPTDGGPRTCLGGLLPLAGPGPDAAGQPAFVDPTPARPGSGDEVVLIPDGSSKSSEVVRVRWNPGSGLFEYLDTVTMDNDGRGARPVAASLGPDGAVYVVFQRSGTVQRISSPASDTPAVRVVGSTSDGRGASAVAAGRNAAGAVRVYVAEASGLRVLAPNGVLPPATQPSFALPDAATDAGGPTNVSALAYDLREDRLWVGTADGVTQADAGRDRIHRITITSGDVDAGYATGYSMIGGFGLRADGMLYVADEPALLDPVEPLGTGRLFQVGLPAAHIARGPLQGDVEAPDRGYVSDDTPEFEVAVGADQGIAECRLTGGELGPGAWAPCSPAGRFTPAAPLAQGDYVLAVRAVAGLVTGLAEVHRFKVDTTPPARPVIVSPAQDAIVNATPWFAFTSEAGARYECRWDDTGTFAPCEPGRTRTFLENAHHELQIRAIDRAGNVSESSEARRFEARGNVTKVTIDSGPVGPTTDRDPTFTYSADLAGVQFGCRLSGQPFTICTGPKSYADLADGTYTFEVRAKDQAGNVTPLVGRTFTVDTRGPAARLQGPGEGETIGTSTVTMVLGADEEGSTFSCRLDGTAFGACDTPHVLSGLQDGTHTFDVIATDALGNQGAVLSRHFTVVAGFTPPPPPAPPAPGTTVTVTDQASGLPVVLRIADIDRRVKLDELREAGITVTIIPATGAKLIRFRIFKVPNGRRGRVVARAATANASAARGKLVATVYRKARKGRFTVTLTRRELRKLTAGSYRLEVSSGSSKSRLGKAVTRTFTVTR